MVRSKLCALTFAADQRPASGPRPSRSGRSLLRQREEQAYRCSLIYRCPFYGCQAHPPAIPVSAPPSKPVRPRVVGAKSAQLRFRQKLEAIAENCVRFLAPPLKTEPASLGFGFVLGDNAKSAQLRFRQKLEALAENCVRFLAPPLKTEPASLGFGFVLGDSAKSAQLRFRQEPAAIAENCVRFLAPPLKLKVWGFAQRSLCSFAWWGWAQGRFALLRGIIAYVMGEMFTKFRTLPARGSRRRRSRRWQS